MSSTPPVGCRVIVADVQEARQVAETLMRDSPHHRGVEVRLDEAKLIGLGTLADRSSRLG